MKLLLDQCLPRSAGQILKRRGFDALHTGDCGLARASDEELLEYAVAENRVIVTMDADFHHLLALRKACAPSVIRVREEGLTAVPLSRLLADVVERCKAELTHGAVVSATTAQVRVHALPIDT